MGLSHSAPVGDYTPTHVNATSAIFAPLGAQANTTSTTAIAAPGLATVTPASMANISVSDILAVYSGIGTAELIQVLSTTPTTFTTIFANTHTNIAAPAAPSVTGNTGTGSAFTLGQTANVAISFVTATGETLPSPNSLATIAAAGDNIVVTLPAFPANVTGANVYVSGSSGSATIYRVGTGTTSVTSAGTVTVTGFPVNTNPQPLATNTSGTYSIASHRSGRLGMVAINAPGNTITITLSDGNPADLTLNNGTGGKSIAVITPTAAGYVNYQCRVKYGLWYTVTGTTAGDYTIMYMDMPL